MKTYRVRFRFLILLAISLLLVVAANGFTQGKSEEPAKSSTRSTGTASNPLSSDGGDVGAEEYGGPSDNQEESSGGYGGFGGGFGRGGGLGPGGGPFDSFGGVQGNNQRLIQGYNYNIMISWSKDNDELRGFSHKSGEWTNLKIEPQEKLEPVVSTDVAAVRVGDTMAAYSGTTGTWGVLKLSEGSKAIAIVGTNIVQTTDNDYLYTFAAAKGKWTSPNDPKFHPSSDPLSSYMEDYESGYGTMISGPGPGMIPGSGMGRFKPAQFDQNSLNLARQLRGKGLDDSEARAKLSQAVANEFDQRQNSQKTEALRQQEKLKQIQDAIQRREALRERIIQRRVDELLDPNVDWDSLSSSPAGTPIELSGPPHIPGVGPYGGPAKR